MNLFKRIESEWPRALFYGIQMGNLFKRIERDEYALIKWLKNRLRISLRELKVYFIILRLSLQHSFMNLFKRIESERIDKQ